MTPIEILSLFTVLVIAFLLRLIPSRVNGYFGSDAFYHVMVARKARELGRLPDKDPGLVPEMTRVYPPLLHAILYPFKGAGERMAMVALSPVLDIVTMLALYFLAVKLGVEEPLWPLVLYAVSPMNIIDAASLNARPLANLSLVLSLGFMYLYWQDGGLFYLIISALASAGVMLSNKMALQVLVPCTIALCVVMLWDEPLRGILVLASLGAGVGIATAATLGGYLRRPLPDHIKFIMVHVRQGEYSTGRSSAPSPLNLAKSNPLSVLGPLLGLVWVVTVISTQELQFLLTWSLPVLLLALLWIWGDSWRYLQFGTIPSVLMISTVLTGDDVDGAIGIVTLVAVTAALAIATAVQLRRAVRADPAAKLIDSMRKLPPEWKARLNGALVYSNIAHYSVPLELGAKMFSGNPSSEGMKLYFKTMRMGTTSLRSISSIAHEALGKDLDYFLIFKGFKEPTRDGFGVLFESESMAILVTS